MLSQISDNGQRTLAETVSMDLFLGLWLHGPWWLLDDDVITSQPQHLLVWARMYVFGARISAACSMSSTQTEFLFFRNYNLVTNNQYMVHFESEFCQASSTSFSFPSSCWFQEKHVGRLHQM